MYRKRKNKNKIQHIRDDVTTSIMHEKTGETYRVQKRKMKEYNAQEKKESDVEQLGQGSTWHDNDDFF